MLKKILSIFLSVLIFWQSIWQITYWLTPVNQNSSLSTAWGLTSLWSNFLSTVSPGIVSVNFKNITSANAGQPMAVWTNSSSFPKEFKLPQGMSIKIDKDALDSKLVKINNAKQKKVSLENAGIQVWDISSELILLPDRIQIKEKTTLTFKTNAQLNIIKSQVYWESEFDSQLSKINTLSKNNWLSTTNFDQLKAINELESNVLKWLWNNRVWLKNIDKLPQSSDQINREALLWMQKECKKENWDNSAMCSLDKVSRTLQTADKIVELEENIEISLIPPSSIGWNYDFIKMDPSEVRITRGQILEIFNNYWLVISQIEDEWEYPSESQPANPPRENPLTEDYCEDRENTEKCKELLDDKNDITQKVYTKDLLNWFTLWEADSYKWSKTIKVGAFGVYKKLASASIKFYYSYWVGLRIPIQSAVLVRDSSLDDFRTSNQEYKVRIWLKTIDADTQYYSNVGLEWDPTKNWGNDWKLFEWKEFVLEFWAWIQIDLRVIWDIVDFHENIGLMSILATYFKDVLIDDFWLTNSEVSDMISSNKLDKWKHFIPAFAWENNVNLLDVSSTIPIYATAWFQLLARLTLKAYLWWNIKFDCDPINSIGWCDGKQEFTDSWSSPVKDWSSLGWTWELPTWLDDYKWKEYTATATYTDNWRQSDDLWFYQNYGPVLSDFLYIPKLVIKLFAKGWVKVYLPVLGWESYWTPDVEIFSMEISSEALSLDTHNWTDGIVDATKENKIYSTDPAITIINPDINISQYNNVTQNWASTSQVSITTNKSNNTYDMYTILPSDSTSTKKNPYCENARDGRRPNGDKWTAPAIMRDEPQNDVVLRKSFDVRARWCALNWAMTDVVTKTVNLENKAFDVYLFPWSENSNTYEYPVNTYDRIYAMTQYDDKWMKVRYTLDGSIPSCDENWDSILFQWDKIDLVSLGKQELRNQFPLTIKAIACNSDNMTLNKITTRTYTINNHSFDPHISVNHLQHNIWISSLYYDHTWYYTYISYSITRDDPTCSSPSHYVSVYGWNGINNFGLMQNWWLAALPWVTIKAKTCIKNPEGALVFGSDIVGTRIDWMESDQYDFLQEQQIVDLENVELWEIFDGFWWEIWPDFSRELWSLLLWQDLTMDWLIGFNTFMTNGGFGADVFSTMSTFGTRSTKKSLLGMASMLQKWKMTRWTVLWFGNMFEAKQITPKGISQLANLYKKYNIGPSWSKTVKEQKEEKPLNSDLLQNGEFLLEPAILMPVYDEYVVSKLWEINQCYVDLYNSQVKDILDTVSDFQKSIGKTKDDNQKWKYIQAIEKMNNIKKAIEQKYKSVFGIE